MGKHTFLLSGKILSRTVCVFLFNELQIYVYGLLALMLVFSNKLSKREHVDGLHINFLQLASQT